MGSSGSQQIVVAVSTGVTERERHPVEWRSWGTRGGDENRRGRWRGREKEIMIHSETMTRVTACD